MKKVGEIVREKSLNEIKDGLEKSQGCFFVSFAKIATKDVTIVRNDLQRNGASMLVAKNALIEKAVKPLDAGDISKFLCGETGVVFVNKDLVAVSKILVDFNKTNENFLVKGGLLNKKAITGAEVAALAKLPSREVLLGQAVGAMAAPISGFLSTMNQVILKFVYAVEEIKKKKEAGGQN
jgi:large subunit ribosomal protein L10